MRSARSASGVVEWAVASASEVEIPEQRQTTQKSAAPAETGSVARQQPRRRQPVPVATLVALQRQCCMYGIDSASSGCGLGEGARNWPVLNLLDVLRRVSLLIILVAAASRAEPCSSCSVFSELQDEDGEERESPSRSTGEPRSGAGHGGQERRRLRVLGSMSTILTRVCRGWADWRGTRSPRRTRLVVARIFARVSISAAALTDVVPTEPGDLLSLPSVVPTFQRRGRLGNL